LLVRAGAGLLAGAAAAGAFVALRFVPLPVAL
jgi:hypothetical protein